MKRLSVILILILGCQVDHVASSDSDEDPFHLNNDSDFVLESEDDYIETCDAQSGLCWSWPINVEVDRDEYDEYYSDKEEPCASLGDHLRPAEYVEMYDVTSRCLFEYYSVLIDHDDDDKRKWICLDTCDQPDIDITTGLYDTGIYVAYCSYEHPFPKGKMLQYFIRCVKPID